MRHLRSLAVVPAAAIALGFVPVVHAATVNIDSWNGKTKQGHGMTAYRVRPKAKVSVSFSVTCKTPAGEQTSFALAAEGKLKGGKLKAKPVEDQGTPGGKLTVTGTFKPGKKAKGKATWSIPAEVATDCSGKDTFSKLKYVLSHGG